MNTKRNILLRVYLSFVLFVLIAVAIIFQTFNIQYKQGDHWKAMSDSLTTNLVTIKPIRGNIYSANEKLLLTSLPIYEIRIDFKTSAWQNEVLYNSKIDSLCRKLSKFFKDKSASEYKRSISNGRRANKRYFLLKRNINHNQLKAIKEFPIFRQGKFKAGFIAEQRSKRIYPFGLLAKRTLGNKNPNIAGVGLERAYNDFLAGKSGKRLMQKISGGNWIPISYENDIEPEDGKDIITTIDINIQDFTEEALLQALLKHNADNGCVVVMEVKTGHVKAIANLEKNSNGNYYETFNYAVGASREPGSTFKLASAIILLEQGKIKPNQLVDTKEGEIQFFDRVMKDATPYGKITFQRAFEVSSNVAFSDVCYKNYSHCPEKFIEELKKLNITEPLGLPIAGEGIPVFKHPDSSDWSGTTLPWMSIGYEVQVTPVQILTLYNSIANNGKMIKPLFVTEVREVGKKIEEFETETVDNKICSNRTLEWIQLMLKGVVERGTASSIRSGSYKIAGKTGTNLIAKLGSYEHEKTKVYQASFVGYFPADDPKYSCIVVIYNPDPEKGSVYGGLVAAPVFKKISDKLYASNQETYKMISRKFNYNNLPSVKYGNKDDMLSLSKYLSLNVKLEPDVSDWAYISSNKDALVLKSKTLDSGKVPDVKGMALSDAVFLLENLGLKVKINGFGKVKSQSLEPGSLVQNNDVIELILI